MKATWLDREHGVYRIGDEHGDFIDDTGHPSRWYANPAVKDTSVERRWKRRMEKARHEDRLEDGNRRFSERKRR